MIFAMGTGLSSLTETKSGYNGNGFCVYGAIGLDIAISDLVGFDFIYRYHYI